MKGNKICPLKISNVISNHPKTFTLNLVFFQIEGKFDSDLSSSGKKITRKSCDIEGDEVTLFTPKVYIYRDNVFEKKSFFFGGGHSYSY